MHYYTIFYAPKGDETNVRAFMSYLRISHGTCGLIAHALISEGLAENAWVVEL